jgi:hypothetical protein
MTYIGSRDRLVFGFIKGIPEDTGNREVAMLHDICRKHGQVSVWLHIGDTRRGGDTREVARLQGICSKQGQVSVWLLKGDTRRYRGQGGGNAAGHM